MLSCEQVGQDRRPPVWRTVAFVLLTATLGLTSVAISPLGWRVAHQGSGSQVLLGVLAMLAGLGLPVLLVWRHRYPFVVVLVGVAGSLLLHQGNALPLLALACLIGRRRGPAVWWTSVAVALSSTWAVIADAKAQPRDASFWKTVLGPIGGDGSAQASLSPLEVVLIILAGLTLSIGSGLLVRWRREVTSAQDAVQTERQASERLGEEAARRQERERIAREVHDAMGHRLSLLNLHAGAMEANSADDPRAAESARLVRESAGAAMDDLRSLLDVLREPVGTDLPAVRLSDLPTIVQESFGAGQPLSSSIFIQDADTAHPNLTRAVYRIVQELLTNARKHAPGEQVVLRVEGGPATGVLIEASNPCAPGASTSGAGTSRGLTGITERVELLGGSARFGCQEGTFRAHVEIPWRSV